MKSPLRRHERANFFKYMPASTAAIVLKNRTLQWSSPLTFNDPFDVPREIAAGATRDDLYSALTEYMLSLLRNPPQDTSEFAKDFRLLIEVARRGFPEELHRAIETDLKSNGQSIVAFNTLDELRAQWKDLLSTMRILCLTESAKHAAMWYHYADKYTGVVLEFNCLDYLDSPFLLATAVDYVDEKLPHDNETGLAKIMCLDTPFATKRMMHLGLYTKFSDWSYEKEWRIVDFSKSDEAGLYSYNQFNAQELASIYLGPRIDETVRSEILELSKDFCDARVFDVRIEPTRELSFTAIEG